MTMKLSDVMTKEDEIIRSVIRHLKLAKKDLLRYTEISSQRQDAEIDNLVDDFGSGAIEETIETISWDTEEEGKLFQMMSVIDQWMLTMRRMNMNKDKENKEWFGDDELEKKQVFRVKKSSEKRHV